MNFKVNFVLIASVMIAFGAIIIPGNISAEASQNLVTVTPINEKLSLEKTIVTMNISQENTLPWGVVRGVVSDHVEGYPAIIQFYKGGEPVHVAQVDVNEDGSYEYKFRARSVDNNTGEITNIFEGQHTIKISIVVHNQNQLI
jgi:hypothetical protein